MKKELPIVLAISPRSTRLGVAVFRGELLLNYELFGLSRRQTRTEAAAQSVNDLIHSYGPSLVAVEKFAFPQQKTISLGHLRDKIVQAACDNEVKIAFYSLERVRSHFPSNSRSKLRNSNLALLTAYPELRRYLQGQSKKQEIYWRPMLNAVAIGLHAILARKPDCTPSPCSNPNHFPNAPRGGLKRKSRSSSFTLP